MRDVLSIVPIKATRTDDNPGGATTTASSGGGFGVRLGDLLFFFFAMSSEADNQDFIDTLVVFLILQFDCDGLTPASIL